MINDRVANIAGVVLMVFGVILVLVSMLFSTPVKADFDVVVSKRNQTMSVFQDGELIERWPVSTARKG